jgi:hypothetical protein
MELASDTHTSCSGRRSGIEVSWFFPAQLFTSPIVELKKVCMMVP